MVSTILPCFLQKQWGQVKTNKNHSAKEHSTAQHSAAQRTLLLGNALFDQTGPEPGGSSHPCPEELHQGDPISSLKSVSFECLPVAVPLPNLPLMASLL